MSLPEWALFSPHSTRRKSPIHPPKYSGILNQDFEQSPKYES